MFRWIVRKLLGATKREIKKTITQSATTRTVATATVSGLAICRGIVAFAVELGLIPEGLQEETALVLYAVIIPLLSRLLAIIRVRMSKNE